MHLLARVLLIVTALNAAICGSAGSCRAQQILEDKDPSTGEVEYYTASRRPSLDGGSFITQRYVSFDLHTYMPQMSASLPYLLQVITSTPKWVGIEEGTSLRLTLDQTQEVSLAGNGSCGKRRRDPAGAGDLLQEFAIYPLSQDQLLLIGRAKTVAFRLVGSGQTITGAWNHQLVADAASLAAKGDTLFGGLPGAMASERSSHGEEYSARLRGLGLDQVERLVDAAQYECAAELLKDVLTVKESGRGYFLQGEIARRRSFASESLLNAIAAYERATRFTDAPAEAYRQAALLQRARGEHRAAVAAFKRYLELAPTAADAPLVREYLHEHEERAP